MLAPGKPLRFEVVNQGPRPVSLVGWQRGDLESRECRYSDGGRDGPKYPVLPSFELRLVAPNGRIKVAGF
jgi:hypothetical protein